MALVRYVSSGSSSVGGSGALGPGSVTDAEVSSTAAISADKLADGASNKVFTVGERTKLQGIAVAATSNSTDVQLRDRSTHTGTQSVDTLTDSATKVAMLATERSKLSGVAVGATVNSPDSTLLSRVNHTGAQAISTVTNLQSSLDALLPVTVPINVQTGTTYTFVLADASRLTRAGNAGAQTYTIPPNSSVAYPVGTVLEVLRYGAGTLSVVAGVGVTLRPSSPQTARAQYSTITFIQVAANEWIAGGDLT